MWITKVLALGRPPWLAAALLVAATMAAAAPAGLTTHRPEQSGDGGVTTTSGVQVDVTYEADQRALFASVRQRDGRPAPLADGGYRLTNGGAIRVSGGRIVWDAFGVVDKLSRGVPVDHPGDNNG